MKFRIVIPTHKRHHSLLGLDYFKDARFVLPESQRDPYLKAIGNAKRMIVIPDEHAAHLPAKRNWILQNVARPLLMIDDDVSGMVGFYKRKNNRAVEDGFKVAYPDFMEMASQCFELADQMGCKMWGVAQNKDGRQFKDFAPFNLVRLILGPFQAHLKHDLVFDEEMGTKEDYDMALQQLATFGKMLRVNFLAYDCKHGDNEGGAVASRTKEKEIEFCKRIMMKWGKKVIRYKIPPKKTVDMLNPSSVNPGLSGI